MTAGLPDLRHGVAVGADEVALHYVAQGPPEGPLVLLLHGFPQFWYSWRRQIPALAAAGYHVVAPDLRGYGRSGKPAGVASYGMARLLADVSALLDHFLLDQRAAALAGHDWGGVIGWAFAAAHPERLDRLVILNAPHPQALAREYRRLNLEQLRRSWYLGPVQLPWLPERVLSAAGYWGLRAMLRASGSFQAADADRYVAEMARPGALRSSLHYYRAALRDQWRGLVGAGPRLRSAPITVPTLVLWGEPDWALSASLAEGLEAYVTGPLQVRRLVGASHWVHEQAPEACTAAMLEFLAASVDGAPERERFR